VPRVGPAAASQGAAIQGNLRTELERALSVGDRASNAILREQEGRWSVQGDPTEGALLVAARKAGLAVNGGQEPRDSGDGLQFSI